MKLISTTSSPAGNIGVLTSAAILGAAVAWALNRQQKSNSSKPIPFPKDADKVLEFWFHSLPIKELFSTYWFPPSNSPKQEQADKTVIDAFSNLLKSAETGELDFWADHSPHSLLALILILDQFSRHIYRKDKERIVSCDKKATGLCELMISKGWDKHLNTSQLCFALMPYRHSATIERLEQVMKIVGSSIESTPEHTDVLNKFRRATMRRLEDLQGKVSQQEPNYDILAFHPNVHNLDDIVTHPVSVSVIEFLKKYFDPKVHDTLVVSLSGGVDSMVIAKILVSIRHLFSSPKIVAVHIDYGNRPESGEEANYVENWCKENGIIFKKRRIDEYKRGVTKREEYEQVTRDIRFGLYKSLLSEYNAPSVFFGHHQGDLQENVISNAMKRAEILDLGAMPDASIVNQVLIWRPLLPHVKKEIFEFAHRYGVPYFKDSTPLWSTRGKMRTKLVPLLEDMFGQGFLANLSILARDSSDLKVLVEKNIFEPFMQNVHRSDIAVWVDCEKVLDQPIFFWKEAFKYICHNYLSEPMIGEKSLESLIERLSRTSKPFHGWITLKKDTRSLVSGSSIVLFRKEFFPEHSYFEFGTSIEVDQKKIFGCWEISLRRVDNDPKVVSAFKEKLSLWEVLTGDFEYIIPDAPPFIINLSSKNCHQLPAMEKLIKDFIPIVVQTSKEANKATKVIVHLTFNRSLVRK